MTIEVSISFILLCGRAMQAANVIVGTMEPSNDGQPACGVQSCKTWGGRHNVTSDTFPRTESLSLTLISTN